MGTRAILLVVLEANNWIDNSAPLLNHGSSRVLECDWPILFSTARASGRVNFITSFTIVFTAASTGLTDAIAADLADLRGWRAYLCGAPPMVEATSALIKQRGVASEHTYADAFYASGT